MRESPQQRTTPVRPAAPKGGRFTISLCIVALAAFPIASPAAAQTRSAMQVTVTVGTAAPSAAVRQVAPSFMVQPRTSAAEVHSQLAINAKSSYVIRLKTDGDASTTTTPLEVRGRDGHFQTVDASRSPIIASMDTPPARNTPERMVDVVLRMPQSQRNSPSRAVICELVATRLDM